MPTARSRRGGSPRIQPNVAAVRPTGLVRDRCGTAARTRDRRTFRTVARTRPGSASACRRRLPNEGDRVIDDRAPRLSGIGGVEQGVYEVAQLIRVALSLPLAHMFELGAEEPEEGLWLYVGDVAIRWGAVSALSDARSSAERSSRSSMVPPGGKCRPMSAGRLLAGPGSGTRRTRSASTSRASCSARSHSSSMGDEDIGRILRVGASGRHG